MARISKYYIRSLSPSTVLNDRSTAPAKGSVTGRHAGDYLTPEGFVPSADQFKGDDWEHCETMQVGTNYGYHQKAAFRTFPDLLRLLVDITSKGGNLILNIGPDGNGEIVPEEVAILNKFGDWMDANFESIHATRASPLKRLPFDGRCTYKAGADGKPNVIYLHIFTWLQDGKLRLPISNEIKSAYLLADPAHSPLELVNTEDGQVLTLPQQAPDPVDSVVAVEFEGTPVESAATRNLAQGKPVEVSSVWAGREDELNKSHITDGDKGTLWAAEPTARTAWVTVDLQAEHEVSSVMLSDAPYGRTQAFHVEAQVDGEWKKIAEGTTIGDELHLSFPPVKAQLFRLVIDQANDVPTLAEFQLFE